MSNQETTGGLTKFQLALLIGLPVTALGVGAAVYYWQSRPARAIDKPRDEEKPATASSASTNGEEATKDTPELPPAQQAQVTKQKGNKYFKGGKYEQAIRCYTEAIELCPPEKQQDLATYYQNRAAAYEQQNNFEQVIADATKALELNNRYSKALMKRARAYEQLNRKEECLQDLTAVCLVEGFNNPSWMTQADRVLKEIGKEKASEYFKKRKPIVPSPTYVKAYLDSFNEDVIFSEEHKVSEDVPEDSPFLQALTSVKEKKFGVVAELCTKEIEKGPGPFFARAFALRGTLFCLTAQVKEAISDLTQVINMDDDKAAIKLKVNCLIKRGSLHMQEGRDSEALLDFNKAISLDPDNSDIYHHRGQINFLTLKLSEAKEDFEKCLSLNRSFVPAKIQLAYCIYKSAIISQAPILAQGAVDMMEQVVESHPDSPDAISLYAQVLQEHQRFDKAAEKFDQAIALQPDNPVHYVYKSLLMVQSRQDIAAAVELVNKAIEIDDKCDFAYETLATLEVQRGNIDKAISLFQKGIDLVRTETEMAQTFSLCEAAKAQKYVTENMGLTPPSFPYTTG